MSHHNDRRSRKLRVERLESREMLAGDWELVKDIYPGSASSAPTSLVEANGRVYFNASSPGVVSGLWVTDGTQVGTTLVKANQGIVGLDPQKLTNVNGTIYFTARNSAGRELWKSDGTETGTLLVKDIFAGSSGSGPHSLTNVSGTLFFAANDGVSGYELWKSDGTGAGTVRVRSVSSQDGPSLAISAKTTLINVNGTLFFNGGNSEFGDELWKSDGTAAGTVLVKDIFPNASSSLPRYLTNVNGTLFFAALEASQVGRELWRSDGSASGTIRVKDIWAGGGASNPRYLTNVNGSLFFSASDGSTSTELWKSDGSLQGTVLVKDIYPGIVSSYPQSLTNVAGTLFFSVLNTNLWKSDGTPAGTVLVKNFSGQISSFSENVVLQSSAALYFRADNNILWKSNGTPTGTESVQFPDGSTLHEPSRTIFVGDRIFVVGSHPDVGRELFTQVLINPPAITGDYNRNGVVDFADYELWKTDFGSGTKLQADGNADGIVDAADYTIWRDALPTPAATTFTVAAASAAVSAIAPQPIAASPVRREGHAVSQREELPPLTRGAHDARLLLAREAAFAEWGAEEAPPDSAVGRERAPQRFVKRVGVKSLRGNVGQTF